MLYHIGCVPNLYSFSCCTCLLHRYTRQDRQTSIHGNIVPYRVCTYFVLIQLLYMPATQIYKIGQIDNNTWEFCSTWGVYLICTYSAVVHDCYIHIFIKQDRQTKIDGNIFSISTYNPLICLSPILHETQNPRKKTTYLSETTSMQDREQLIYCAEQSMIYGYGNKEGFM